MTETVETTSEIPIGRHRLARRVRLPMYLIEVQTGADLGTTTATGGADRTA